MAVQGLDENASLPTEPQLADSLTEALKSLKEGSGLLQEPIPPEGLSGMFSGLNLDNVRMNINSLKKCVYLAESQFLDFFSRKNCFFRIREYLYEIL